MATEHEFHDDGPVFRTDFMCTFKDRELSDLALNRKPTNSVTTTLLGNA